MNRKAFTLIELLVVIAIIAILAAILFPVFAQAKAAAKKTQSLSNVKQIDVACFMYNADNDDVFPLSLALTETGGWTSPGGYVRFPYNWRDAFSPEIGAAAASVWANSMFPYIKSADVFHGPTETILHHDGVDYSKKTAEPRWTNYNYNGLLTEYSASAVASPSSLTSFWQGYGNISVLGYADSNPYLYCPEADKSCRYVPASATCDGSNGTWSNLDPGEGITVEAPGDYYRGSHWVHGRGSNVAYADGHAKFQALGGNVGGLTDYRHDPFNMYDSQGRVHGLWAEENACHVLLFRPDFDYQNFGTPLPFDY